MATKKVVGLQPVPPPVDNVEDEIQEIPSHPPEVPEIVETPTVVTKDSAAPTPAPPPAPPLEKVDKEKVLTFIEDLIDTLTFKRVGLIALLTVIGLSLFALYENRQSIVENLVHKDTSSAAIDPTPADWSLSDASKTALQNLAKTTAVSFIAITDVDLKKNRKVVRYYYIDDSNIKLSSEALRAIGLPQAVFDYDAKNTAQMVSVLSNEFKCNSFKDTIYFRYAPEFEDAMPSICRLAIPPFVGSFIGFITVGLANAATSAELDSIRLEVSRIAVDIYLNDVIKKPASQGRQVAKPPGSLNST